MRHTYAQIPKLSYDRLIIKTKYARFSLKRPARHDVAKRADMSQSTISRVFRGKTTGWISAELEARIRQSDRNLLRGFAQKQHCP